MNYYIEGLQGSGKTTRVRHMQERYPHYRVYHEGDYCPVSLAWCAYVTEEVYEEILNTYSSLEADIRAKTVTEGKMRIIAYTQVLTDIPGFHKHLETYEIYNSRVSTKEHQHIVLDRYRRYQGNDAIFECALFQNEIEELLLYAKASEADILDFYRDLAKVLAEKPVCILYQRTKDVEESIRRVRRERVDASGQEMWYPLMLRYFETSPYAIEQGLKGDKALLDHLAYRQELELRICKDMFPGRYEVKENE